MEKIKEQSKSEYLIDVIKRMNTKDKLRLAICMCDNDWLHLGYDKNQYWEHFDKLLKEIDEEYRTTLINFAKYKTVMLTMAKIREMEQTEQNKVALYLFNKIN